MSVIRLEYGISRIEHTDFFRKSTIVKGIKLSEANHLDQVMEIIDKSNNSIVISGRCLPQTNISKDPYIIQIEVRKLH